MKVCRTLARGLVLAAAPLLTAVYAADAPRQNAAWNLAPLAMVTASYVSGHEALAAVNNGNRPAHSNDKSHGAYGNWPRQGTQWVEYQWPRPISTARIDVYWFDDHKGVRLPKACRLLYWNGERFVPVDEVAGLGLAANTANTTTFREVQTTRLRLEMDSNDYSTGILQWRVFDSGKTPDFPPRVKAGQDRIALLGTETHLSGAVTDGKPGAVAAVRWSKESGPGDVTFASPHAASTAAQFSRPGQYVLRLTAGSGDSAATDRLEIEVVAPPPAPHWQPLTMRPYRVDSPLWSARLKQLIIHWIPHCCEKLSQPKLREGGIDNFVAAADKLAGRRHGGYHGPPWAPAYVYNTVESMCWALMLDAHGDRDIAAAQQAMRAKLDEWIPVILAAQEPDGYLHPCYTVDGRRRWSNKTDHEGYTAGYFIEAAMAHWLVTDGRDDRLYRAARRLADCWLAHLGPPPKQRWYDGHEELEQALIRFSQFVDQRDGAGQGRPYLALARFLMDCRGGGEPYDQSHRPVVQQFEAVGHSVRASYLYAAMAGYVLETGDRDYLAATQSLWSNLIHKKYYVTGGLGSGETSEGFGPSYSLPNNAYCESCANCGELYFQHRLNLLWRDGRYADLAEDTLYNAILGDYDLSGQNFTYTNSLDSGAARYPWHDCPCCVGNFPRTLLMLPVWMYATGAHELIVNEFVGGRTVVDGVAGTAVEIAQQTDYPWQGKVAITIAPRKTKRFAVLLRSPQRNASRLYTTTPACGGITALTVNGAAVAAAAKDGYVTIERTWHAGDRIEFAVPLPVQRVRADERVVNDRGRIALRRGPLIYCLERVDQDLEGVLSDEAPLAVAWKPHLLGGVSVIQGQFANGKELTAIPYFARNNRGGRAVVWIHAK
jgi:uncharacterized protein